MNQTQRNTLTAISGVALWLGVSGAKQIRERLPACPFKTLTGLDCPGCGVTRAGYSITHGDILAAIDHNALVVFGPIIAVTLWLVATRTEWLPKLGNFIKNKPTMTFVSVTAAFWIARLIPVAPFTYLASSAY